MKTVYAVMPDTPDWTEERFVAALNAAVKTITGGNLFMPSEGAAVEEERRVGLLQRTAPRFVKVTFEAQ